MKLKSQENNPNLIQFYQELLNIAPDCLIPLHNPQQYSINGKTKDRGKEPRHRNWNNPDLSPRISTTDEVISNINDNYNVGIHTGKSTRLLIIDCDRHGKEDGVALFQDWMKENKLELQPTTTTPRDGEHYIFRVSEDSKLLDLPRLKKNLLPQVDILFGGYAVSAGSKSYNNKEYQLTNPEIQYLLPVLEDYIYELSKDKVTPEDKYEYLLSISNNNTKIDPNYLRYFTNLKKDDSEIVEEIWNRKEEKKDKYKSQREYLEGLKNNTTELIVEEIWNRKEEEKNWSYEELLKKLRSNNSSSGSSISDEIMGIKNITNKDYYNSEKDLMEWERFTTAIKDNYDSNGSIVKNDYVLVEFGNSFQEFIDEGLKSCPDWNHGKIRAENDKPMLSIVGMKELIRAKNGINYIEDKLGYRPNNYYNSSNQLEITQDFIPNPEEIKYREYDSFISFGREYRGNRKLRKSIKKFPELQQLKLKYVIDEKEEDKIIDRKILSAKDLNKINTDLLFQQFIYVASIRYKYSHSPINEQTIELMYRIYKIILNDLNDDGLARISQDYIVNSIYNSSNKERRIRVNRALKIMNSCGLISKFRKKITTSCYYIPSISLELFNRLSEVMKGQGMNLEYYYYNQEYIIPNPPQSSYPSSRERRMRVRGGVGMDGIITYHYYIPHSLLPFMTKLVSYSNLQNHNYCRESIQINGLLTHPPPW
jgi:hypothetical protein